MSNTASILKTIQERLKAFEHKPAIEPIGRIISIGDGIAVVEGLPTIGAGEMMEFIQEEDTSSSHRQKQYGVALNLESHRVGAMILGSQEGLKEGGLVKPLGRILSIPVGDAMVGRVVNPLGEPVDHQGPIKTSKTYPLEKIAPGVITRQGVDQPLQTGVKAIDSMIPIGRGQRELIIGDRQTGKTAIAIDTIINQRGGDVICIYVAIGQKESKIARIVAELKERGAMDHTVVVVAGASDPASLWYTAAYAGCAIGEYFMDQGKDALVIYDDLSKHAWSYRQISLLLKRPSGREAYPGDVFYLHSRLLERAAKLNKENGGGSLTALPIIETQAGDVSAYIPTNVISITDGQIYLETDLFYQGIRPALNVGLSVSRVGSKAQTKAMKKVAGKLRLELAQFRELAAFAQFATDLDPQTRSQIERGRRLTEVLKQDQYVPLDVARQVISIYAATNGFFDHVNIDDVRRREAALHAFLTEQHNNIITTMNETGDLTKEMEEKLKAALENWKNS